MRVFDYAINSFLSYIRVQTKLTMQMDITNACNLACAHCYHKNHNNKGVLGFDGWLQIIDQYEKLLKKLRLDADIQICGGEPTLSPNLLKIIKELDQRFPKVAMQILSNGTLLSDSRVEKLRPYNIAFQISLDGPDQDSHDLVRGPGSFDKAVLGIQILVRKRIPLTLLAVLSKRNATRISDFFSFAKDAGVHAMNFTRLIPEGCGKQLVASGDDQELLGMDLKEALTNIVKYSRHYGVTTNTDKALYHLVDPNLGRNSHFGWQGIIVDYRGNLKVSSRADYVLGNILEQGLETLFLKNQLMERLRTGKIAVCGRCQFYKRCGGDRNVSYAHFGSFLERDPGCWL